MNPGPFSVVISFVLLRHKQEIGWSCLCMQSGVLFRSAYSQGLCMFQWW